MSVLFILKKRDADMLRVNKASKFILSEETVTSPFSAGEFITSCVSLLPQINSEYKRIHSGLFIPDKYKDKISSLKIEGNFLDFTGHSVFEIIVIKAKIGANPLYDKHIFEEYISEYMKATSVKGAFVAVTFPALPNMYVSYFVKAPSTSTIDVPVPLIESMCKKALNKYLSKKCSVILKDIDTFFGDEYCLFDDTMINLRSKVLDNALKELKVCDLYAENTAITASMAELVTDYRMRLNVYFPNVPYRTEEFFMSEYYKNSAYFTNLSEAALLLVKIELSILLGERHNGEFNAKAGNILVSDLFPGVKFDIILTTPPHVRFEKFSAIKETLKNFESYKTKSDLYCYYIERAFSLLSENGFFSAILCDRWMTASYGSAIREFLLNRAIDSVVLLNAAKESKQITNAVTMLSVFNSEPQKFFEFSSTDTGSDENLKASRIKTEELSSKAWIFTAKEAEQVISKMNSLSVTLSSYANGHIYRGILTGMNKAFVVDSKKYKALCSENIGSLEALRGFFSGREIKRYKLPKVKKYLISFPKGFTNKDSSGDKPLEWMVRKFPSVMKHLSQFEADASKRFDKGDYWWELRSCRYYDKFESVKLICPSIVRRLSATIDTSKSLSNDKTIIIADADYFILGLLNSDLFDFYFRQKAKKLLNNHYELSVALLGTFPVFKISATNKRQVAFRKDISERAKELFELYNAPSADKDVINEKEKELNNVIYTLYRLTPSEINFVKNN